MTEYSPAKKGEIPRIITNFQNCARCKNDFKDNKHDSLYLGRKYARIFVLGHYLFLEDHSFPRATLASRNRLMSADKYPSIISRQMKAIVYMPPSLSVSDKMAVYSVKMTIDRYCRNKQSRYTCIPRSLSVSDNMTCLERKKLSIDGYGYCHNSFPRATLASRNR